MAVTAVLAGLAVTTAGPAAAGAVVVRPPECGFTAGPGETESLPGTGITADVAATSCLLVLLPKGGANFVVKAEVAAGVVDRAVVGPGLVVTPSGKVSSHGSVDLGG